MLKVLPELASKGNSNAVSDVGVAGLLASAACKGALFNVDINLGSLPDDYASEIRENAPKIQEESRVLSRQVMDAVRENSDYLTCEPVEMSPSIVTSLTPPSPSSAANIMPSLITPLSFVASD